MRNRIYEAVHIYSGGERRKLKKKEKEREQIEQVCNLTKELTRTKLAADVFGAPSQQNGGKKVG